MDKNGYAIFYSPVYINPKIMIIGFNPGGGEESFDESVDQAPKEHDYLKNYKLANNMRKIFEYAILSDELFKSVKLNLIFFRSRQAKDIQNKNLINYSKTKAKEIIQRLQPTFLVVEGFATFNALVRLIGITEIKTESYQKIAIGQVAHAPKNITVLALRHPSGSRGLSEDIFKKMGAFLKKHIQN